MVTAQCRAKWPSAEGLFCSRWGAADFGMPLPPASAGLRQAIGGGLRHHAVLIGIDAGDADAADDLAADDDRQSPLHGRCAPEAKDARAGPATSHAVLEYLGGAAIDGGRYRLVDRHLHAAALGVVQLLEGDEEAVV